jgi:DNA-binding LacI/PurR family transcriptional regulator
VPLVIVDRPTHDARFDQVTLDNRAAMRDVVLRLVDLGHQRVLFVCRSRSRLVTRHRMAGLADVRRKRRIETSIIEFQNDDAFPARRARAHPARAQAADRGRGEQQPPGLAAPAFLKRAWCRVSR